MTIAGQNQGIERFLHTYVNRVLAQFIYPLTASPRFDGTLIADVLEVQTNLEPGLRTHTFPGSSVLVTSAEKAHLEQLSVAKFALSFFGPRPHEGQVRPSSRYAVGVLHQVPR